MKSEIQRAFCLLDSLPLDGMGINHSRSDIAVAQQLLDGADIIIGLQEMAGETVPERMGGSSFCDFVLLNGPSDRFADMAFEDGNACIPVYQELRLISWPGKRTATPVPEQHFYIFYPMNQTGKYPRTRR